MKRETGELLDIFIEDGATVGRVLLNGSIVRVSLVLLTDAHVGDTVSVSGGLAVSRIQPSFQGA